ncbi:MAG: sigma 54-interacting transcriptional regulator [Synergistaceae bacterium]|nr:sigma 54-interacting transcriptional regulator [Synergistaceae bacterium]
MEISETMAAIFDAMSEGILIIDSDARIVFGNKAYCKFLNADFFDLKGQILRNVRPGARLPEVLRTGTPILHAPRREVEDIYFVNMYPICIGGKIAGGLSVVTFIQQAYRFQSVLEEIKQHSIQILKRISKASNARYTFDDIIAESQLSKQAISLAQRAAGTEATIFLRGESGTGKELYAQAIHNASARSSNIFLAINCANFNANTLESELFGYLEGAFTGAKKGGKIGLFEAASGGTLFLDEVSEIDLSLQAKLLRVLQERLIRPLGGVDEKAIDVRIIAACNADIESYIQDGRFRADLYYRLNNFPIVVPPLRQRRDDIDKLIAHVLDDMSRKMKKSISISNEALYHLRRYSWPGNVRELRNVIEFLSYLTDDGVISEDILPETLKQPTEEKISILSQRVKQFERGEIGKLLRINGDNLEGKRKTARQLGISLASLYNKIGR